METLKCTKCKEIKSTDLFYKDKNRKTGFQNQCKICKKAHYKENKEKISEKRKQYYIENKEKLDERTKQFYKENKEKLLEYQKQYSTELRYDLHPSYIKQRLKSQGFKSEQITEELIQLKTITLKTQRLCNQLKN